MMQSEKLKHLLRFGIHAEKDYFVEGKRFYDTAVFNATSVEYTAKAVASLLVGPLSRAEYFIDPNTHAFGQDVRYVMVEGEGGELRLKKSIESLANSYGTPVDGLVGQRPVRAADFQGLPQVESFAARVLGFQEGRLREALEEDSKYLDEGATPVPLLLVAPYFFLNRTNLAEFLPLNIRFAEASSSLGHSRPIYAELVLGVELLDDSAALDEIVVLYRRMKGIAGFLLWVSDFSEHDQSEDRLRALRNLVSALASDGRTVLNLYGGYFSILLRHYGLAGVCHGPGYGEERDVVPVGGGRPVLKFYLTPVHLRLPYRDVETMRLGGAWHSVDEYFDEVCAGTTCRSVIGQSLGNFRLFGTTVPKKNVRGTFYDAITPETRYRLTMHFMEAKAQEFERAASLGLGELREELLVARDKYRRFLQTMSFDHLERWANAIDH